MTHKVLEAPSQLPAHLFLAIAWDGLPGGPAELLI